MPSEAAYNPSEIEPKWQKIWDETKAFAAKDFSKAKKSYLLVEFPYPSGDGLHVGHPRSYTALDVIARKRRLQGENVLYPMGWDAFGLPTENYAIKTGQHPRVVTDKNIANFRRQMKALGLSFDWSREVDTTDPKYYKWTQWIFLQLLKAGLAYQAEMAINWCPKDKIGLANEEVVGGKCERCGTQVTRKLQKQWMLKITAYADRLLKDLDTVDYLPQIKQQQVNWIGRSEGAEIEFQVAGKTANQSNCIVLHGCPSRDENDPAKRTYDKHWIPWLAKSLSDQGILTIAPLMPKPWAAKYEAWKTEFEKQPVTENTILIGHSCGSAFLVRWLGETGQKVRALILVAPWKFADEDRHGQWFETRQEFYSYKISQQISKTVPNIYYFTSNNEENLGKESLKVFKKALGGRVFDLKNHGHYTMSDMGTTEFPELLELVTKTLSRTQAESIRVFTTRPDTLYGVTYLVLAPEHELVKSITTAEQQSAVEEYVQKAASKSDLERTELSKEKTGVFTGAYAVNPINNEKIPVWVADYVLASYGTGAIMAVPAHDERDNEFAKKFELPIKYVIEPEGLAVGYSGLDDILDLQKKEKEKILTGNEPYTFNGEIINSPLFEGLRSDTDKTEVIARIEKEKIGTKAVQYKLRDWVFSRQHYWGEPIPVVHCPKDGVVPLSEKELPLELPHVEKYEPTDTGESPLASITDWVDTKCPKCKGPAKRETDTMPNWAGSSWYFLRYTDAHNTKALADKKKLKYWTPVDIYNGGNEHTTLHLLYSRFWHKFLFDQGFVPTAEPYQHRHSHGLILAEDGRKMSKSWGNVVNPDDIVAKYGADTLRTYEMFLGPFEEAIPWSTNGLIGVRRFLDKVWRLQEKLADTKPDEHTERLMHQTIKKVGDDVEGFRFNTAVSQLMILTNALGELPNVPAQSFQQLLALLMPFAPHLASELLEQIGKKPAKIEWPEYDESKLVADTVEYVVQVAGKRRATVTMSTKATEADVVKAAKAVEAVSKLLNGEPKKVVFVPGRLINLVP